MKCNEQSAATEQGNRGQNDASSNIAAPPLIGHKTQVSHAAHVANSQKGPEKERRSDEDGAMKERFEIVPCQKRKHAVPCKRLCRPKEKRSQKRSDNNDRDKIERQFSYVFQGR